MTESSTSADVPLSEPQTVHIRPDPLPNEPIELSPQDLVFTAKTGFLTLFFPYTISCDTLKTHLNNFARTYYVLCARMSRHQSCFYELRMTGDTGFPFIEQWTPLQSHDALHRHGRIRAEVSDFPVRLPLPFFVEAINVNDLLLGNEPMFKVKLTHYADNCCSLSFTFSNVLSDPPHLYYAIKDLAKLMRQEVETLGPIDHDRCRLWPDRFLVSLRQEKAFPADYNDRKFSANYDITKFDTHQFPGEEITLEMLHFPEEMIQNTLDELNALLENDGKRILKQQLISALLWMLRSELEGRLGRDKKTLLKDTQCLLITDVSEFSQEIVPENYFGNAYAFGQISYKNISNAFPDNDLKHVLLNACLVLRDIWDNNSKPERLAETMIMTYQLVNNQEFFATYTLKIRSCCWSTYVTEGQSFDFGGGPPCFALTCPSFPSFYYSSILCPIVEHEGVFVSLFLVTRHRDTLLNSQVLHHCAPGTRLVFQQNCTHTEAMKLW